MAAQGDVDESVNQWFCAQCWADFDVPDGSTGGGAEPAAKGSAVSKVMAERKELEEAWSPGDDYGVDETPTLSGDAPPPIPAYPGGQSGQQQEQAPPPKKDYQNWSAGAAAAAVDDDTGADEVVAPPPALQTSAPSVATGNVVYNAGGDRSSVSSNEVKPVQGYSQVDRDANGRVGVPTSPGAPAPPAAAVADDFYGPAEPKPPPPAAPLPPAAQEGRGGVGGGGGGRRERGRSGRCAACNSAELKRGRSRKAWNRQEAISSNDNVPHECLQVSNVDYNTRQEGQKDVRRGQQHERCSRWRHPG